MIKKLELSNLYIIIVFIVGVFDIIYGVSFELQQYKNKRESIKTDAYIYAVVTREDKIRRKYYILIMILIIKLMIIFYLLTIKIKR